MTLSEINNQLENLLQSIQQYSVQDTNNVSTRRFHEVRDRLSFSLEPLILKPERRRIIEDKDLRHIVKLVQEVANGSIDHIAIIRTSDGNIKELVSGKKYYLK